MARPDPLEGLDHDHASLSEALDALIEARRAGATAETLGVHAERLRDEFLDHFGDEEEHLFPELAKLLPSTEPELDELRDAHDALCGLAVRIASMSEEPNVDTGGDTQLDALISRLDAAYRKHARREIDVLRGAFAQLSPETRAELIEKTRKV